jgi:hypothetical protein
MDNHGAREVTVVSAVGTGARPTLDLGRGKRGARHDMPHEGCGFFADSDNLGWGRTSGGVKGGFRDGIFSPGAA